MAWDDFVAGAKQKVSDVVEWLDITDPDSGPCIKNLANPDKEQCTNENAVEKNKLFVNGAGIVGGGLLGYKLGENFGTLGKMAGGVIGAWVGCKLSKEVATDVAAASDYTANNKDNESTAKASRWEATFANLKTSGQAYNGKTAVEADITD